MPPELKSPLPEHPGIIFMGTPDFAVPSLKGLIDGGHNVLAVVTQPDRPKGRGRNIAASPVKALALKHGIRTLQPEKVSYRGFTDVIKEIAPDLIIVVAFGQILRKALLDAPEWGVINIHASLLPKYRGAAPIQRAILNDEPSTGLTIMKMDEGLDTGPVLYQKKAPVLRDETAGHLHDRLAGMSGAFLIEFLDAWTGGRIKETAQESSIATYAGKIEKEMCRIDWNHEAKVISAQIRALDPAPGAFTVMGDSHLKLFASTVADETFSSGIPGRVNGNAEGILRIETGRGILGVKELQYPGRKRLHVKDFLMGFNLTEGTILGK
ncbi:MAG: methionyl-tRNA formyltransferase [Deltaproteobacteria bacterium]|nr:methionyl-tRNA formyltransferase [Deltaproteobacteria bacterium]